MADESGADDGGIYSVWDRFTSDEVDRLHDLLALLSVRWAAYKNGEVQDVPMLKALALLLVLFGFAHFPVVDEASQA